MGAGPITFNYGAFVARYPEFAAVSATTAQMYFNEATLYVDNTGDGIIDDPNILAVVLNMATAHVAALNAPVVGGQYNDGAGSQPNSTLVGRIDSATEGSVSVNAEMPDQPGAAAWWQQTKYGSAAWAAMAPYRTMRYLIGPRRSFAPYPGFRGW